MNAHRYHEVVIRQTGIGAVVLYRSTQKAGADIFRKLVGNRKFMGEQLFQQEVTCFKAKRTGILERFVFDKAV